MTTDPQDTGRRLFLACKSNLGRPPEGLAYRIADKALRGDNGVIWAPAVQWEASTVAMTADQAVAGMASVTEARSAMDEAEEFLLELLADGPMAQKEIKDAAHGAGLAWRTVERAKAKLRIEARRENIGEHPRWTWRLPTTAKSATKTATQNNGGLGGLDGLAEDKTANTANTANSESGGLHNDEDDFPEMPDFLRRVR